MDQAQQRSNSSLNQFEGGVRNRNEPGQTNSIQVSAQGKNKGKNQLNKSVNSQQQPKKKVGKANFKRYESNSVDEEEFQDYFINPVKRKEFDMRRKRQQVKEMHNITQFTLGNFGIENKKALKDALPPYPETIETSTDQSKNYATVSLCCLSVTNPFRNKIIHMVTLNKWFDTFILTVITVNCIFLALDQEVEVVTKHAEKIDNVFLIIYTLEMVLKVIAQGFVMRPYSYLRDGWNMLDFVVVLLGWAAVLFEGANNISAIKVIRILRPLRTINQIPKMPSLVSTIMNSLPIMFDVMVLFLFMMVMFGTIATQLLGGHLEKRCSLPIPGKPGNYTIELGIGSEEVMCRTDEDCLKNQPSGLSQNSTCQYYGNPISGTYGFDNVLLSILNIFQIITLEGWTDMMYIVRDTENTYSYDLFFIMCVVLGSFVILNLMVAVQASYLDQAFDAEEQENKEREEKLRLKKEQLENQNRFYDEDEEEQQNEVEQEEEADGKNKDKKKGCCNFTVPDWYARLSLKLELLCDPDNEKGSGKAFERFIVVLILFNTFFMAIEHYDEPSWVTNTGTIANYIFTVIFALEMIMKLIGFGFKMYFSQGFNIFDCFIVIMSFVELLSSDSNSSLSVLRAFRLLRIFKIIKSWHSLRKLLATVLDSLTAITNLAILIFLYLFISALLTKQFYPGQLKDGDGNDSRYSFSTTGDALISVFIILTGENWNEIMIQVIDSQKSFYPAPLFIMIVILGNWMLLNLFLAILLKALSKVPENEEEENAKEVEGEADNAEASPNQDNLEEQSNNVLDSSNSNIEQEFNKIKEELERITKGIFLEQKSLNLKSDESRDQDQAQPAEFSDDGRSHSISSMGQAANRDKKIAKTGGHAHDAPSKSQKQDAILKVFDVDEVHHHHHEDEKWKQQKSLFLFSYDNKFRSFLRDFINNNYFSGFIYHMIALNSLLLILDSPNLSDKYQKETIQSLLTLISIIFIVECGIKIIAAGFIMGEKTYLKDGWNILDFIIVLFSIITMLLENLLDTNVSFIRGFRALRALRPLKFVSKNEGIKTVVNALLESIPSLLNVMLIVLLFLLVFGILGVQLFSGKVGYCNDQDSDIQWKKDCIGNYTTTEIVDNKQVYKVVPREWIFPFNNYNSVVDSMITFFEISTLEMWPGMMYAAIDSYALNHGPVTDNNKAMAIIFIVYIFVTTFFIMNLFISVIVDKFNEEIKKRQGENNFSDEQKEWVKLQRLLVHTNPKIIPVEPINMFRLHCFKVVQSQAFEYIVLTAIVLNTAFMCMDHYGQSQETEEMMQQSNTFFVIFFTCEMVLKITAYGFKYYWYVNWNKFDFIVVILSLIAVDEQFLQQQLNFNPTSLRIIRITRLFRMVKTSQGLRTLLKTLFMSVQNIINTALLLFLILFTFAVAGMSLFATVPDGDFINHNVNFKSFYLSFMTLWRAATGESWNGIMHDCYAQEGAISVIFWIMFQLAAFFIFMNVFIAVIGESFDDNKATEDENDILALKKKDIKAFQNTWAKFNPMGELYMRTVRLPEFLRQLPPPLGYLGIRIEDTKLNKIIFCLNIRDHLGKVYYPEVMWAIFHSIAGMNDENVLDCQQIKNILKIVKMKYKGLGKGINLDQLCGNKYYRKELTAVKYIQAIKILNRWKAYKNHKLRDRETKELQNKLENMNISPQKNFRNNSNHDRQDDPVDVRDIRLKNIGNQIQQNRDRDNRIDYEEDDADQDSHGFSRRKDLEYSAEIDRTRKMDYINSRQQQNQEDGIYVERNREEESDMEYRDDDMGGERNIMSARDRNQQLQDQRSRGNQRNSRSRR